MFVFLLIFQQPDILKSSARMEGVKHSYRLVKRKEAKGTVQRLWNILPADCLCLAWDPSNSSLQRSQDVNCPYCVASNEGPDSYEVIEACRNDKWHICMFINKCTVPVAVSAGENKNTCLSAYLGLSKYVASIVNSPELSEECRKSLNGLLCWTLTRVRNMANVGFLSEHSHPLPFVPPTAEGLGWFLGPVVQAGNSS